MFVNLLELVLNGIFCLMGLLGNTFIVSLNIINWINTTNELNVSDCIVSSLGVTNIFLNCVSFAGTVLYCHWQEIFILYGVSTFYFTLIFFLGGCNLWSVTWLCFYYCMKIVNFNHPLFIWMKVRFPKMVPWLLMGSLFVSLTISIPVALDIHLKAEGNPLSNLSDNGTQTGLQLEYEQLHVFIIPSLIASVAFTIFFFSAAAIIASLYRHMRRMVENADSFRSARLDAHLGAMKTVTMLLILCISYYLAQCLLFLKELDKESTMHLTCELVISAFPTLSSIILILGNPSLKKKLTSSVCHAIWCEHEEARHAS